ncbi:MAG: gfo/Idh/MocA family oxidoreductase [Leptolyngbya sp. PLA3]|nr:MAG: gfo/Idh/MocA family oxidoreductase [Cyanobacteria bacterium CYA]MCE7967201.1 gfo/Idh/MocA family oxidoreductase [Leptolyngbya sp. PL-A3]
MGSEQSSGSDSRRQRWALPTSPRPIAIIGAGGIVVNAHLPAYAACGFRVVRIFDIDRTRAEAAARQFGVEQVAGTLNETTALGTDVVYDLAVPAGAVIGTLEALPVGATALIQKPMGLDLDQASAIVQACRSRNLTAAVNFQLRFAPAVMELSSLVGQGVLGDLTDVEMRVNTFMPWEQWEFLRHIPRMEILYHSIHYVDLMRHLLGRAHGEPSRVMARTTSDPRYPQLASVASTIVLDFGPSVRCTISTNHQHDFGPQHQASHLRVEGTSGAAVARLGVNLNYPRGLPDTLSVHIGREEWRPIELAGNWFPDAFRGPMCNLQRFVAGEDDVLVTRIDDAWKTMAVVEACYECDRSGGVTPRSQP